MTLRVLAGRFSICRLDEKAEAPAAPRDGFYSVTRRAGELSIVCAELLAPAGARVQPGWRVLEVEGPLDFALVGILAALTAALAAAEVSVFAISTFDTDFVLVSEAKLDTAVAALTAAGHEVHW